MKKLFNWFALLCVAFLFTACSNQPEVPRRAAGESRPSFSMPAPQAGSSIDSKQNPEAQAILDKFYKELNNKLGTKFHEDITKEDPAKMGFLSAAADMDSGESIWIFLKPDGRKMKFEYLYGGHGSEAKRDYLKINDDFFTSPEFNNAVKLHVYQNKDELAVVVPEAKGQQISKTLLSALNKILGEAMTPEQKDP